MIVFGNVCAVLAALIYLLPWQLVLNDSGRGSHAGAGLLWSSLLIALPLGLLMSGALLALVAVGGMQWLTPERTLQYLLVLLSTVAITVVVALASALRLEPAGQRPWAIRPLVPWAAWLGPPLVLGYVLLALNTDAVTLPLRWARGIWLAVAVVALLVSAGMLLQWWQSARARRMARLQERVRLTETRDARILDELAQMTWQEDLADLLNFSNCYETDSIRERALAALSEHPDLTGAIASELTAGSAYAAIIYLQAHAPPQPERLKDALAVGIERVAAALKTSIASTHTLYADQGMSEVERVLDAVRAFAVHGVDYRPALLQLRRALDHRRPHQLPLRALAVLDQWLAQPR